MRTFLPVVFALSFGCGSASELSQSESVTECAPPPFAPGDCEADVLNDGTGPDDHRTLCHVGTETWVLYPSGEAWHLRQPDGKADPVVCRTPAD